MCTGHVVISPFHFQLLAQQKENEKKVLLKQARELHNMLQSKKAKERYEKHYSLCWDILQQIVDLATCIGEYKELAQGCVCVCSVA